MQNSKTACDPHARRALRGTLAWSTVAACAAMLPAALAVHGMALGQSPPTVEARASIDRLDKDYAEELPRIAPLEADAALRSFIVQPPFRIELAVAEPAVSDPVAVDFDADGRMYVVEMRGYSEDRDKRLSQIRLLEDADGDGRYETSHVFADDLLWPTAVACYDDGVFVGDPPEILYLKDTDGDRRADVRRTVFTGFEHSNVQGMLNSFRWGLDNRIHVATGTVGGELRRADEPQSKSLALRGRDFAFDPRSLEALPTSGGAQHGMCFDDWGRKFVSSNSDHIQQVMFEDRYVARNAYLAAPRARISIAADGPQAEVFRASPVEPWRIVRTRLRVSGVVRGAIEGGGRPAGYFTGASGVTIYRGDAWPAEYAGLAIVGDVGSNIVHRKRLEANGLEFIARRIDERRELVTSSDIWFRPVQFANAPDGSLYVIDMYREVIEHPDSLPPPIKQHLDLTSGRDRGRIYRVVHAEFKQPSPPRLSSATTAELVACFERSNGWQRDTAARLLYERQDPQAVEPLRRLLAESDVPLARLHALYALDGLGGLTPRIVLASLDDRHARVREHAVRLAERFAPGVVEIRDKLSSMVDDDDLGVRYQLAFTLGEASDATRDAALVEIARRDAGDRWMRLAIQSSLAEGAANVFATLAADDAFIDRAGSLDLLGALAEQVARAGRDDKVAAVARAIDELADSDSATAKQLVERFAEGAAVSRGLASAAALNDGKQPQMRAMLDELLDAARKAAVDDRRPAEARARAVRTLALAEYDDASRYLWPLVDGRQPRDVQLAVIAALGRFTHADVPMRLVEAWPTFSPRLREAAADVLFTRAERVAVLLDAIDAGSIASSDIDPARLVVLSQHRDEAIRVRAARLLAARNLGRRQDVVDAYREALNMQGDAARGKAFFQKTCATCHRLEGVGYEIGPSLATIQTRGAEAILLNVLDPSREVNPQYANYVLVTVDGRTMNGMIASESATSVTLRRAENAEDAVLRVDIDELRSTGLSLMPEGMEQQIDRQGMADLIAYLISVK